jgi:hypothetical protein
MFYVFMNKKNYILIAVVLVLAAVYVLYFTDWFRAKAIQIAHINRPVRTTSTGPASTQLIFGLNGDYSLTEVRVVPLAALQTDKLAQPVWHLVSDEGSDDVNQFFYGQRISGMDSAVEGSRPEPLQPGVTYRLFVTAGRAKGQHDFHIGAAPANTATNQ